MRYLAILVFTLILSVFYVIMKERTANEYSAPFLNFFDEGVDPEVIPDVKSLKKNKVIIFDISNLSRKSFSKGLKAPYMSTLLSRSVNFTSSYNLSPDRKSSLWSFFECLPPYKLYSRSEKHEDLKLLIKQDLRNSSMVNEFRENGYVTRAFFTDSLSNEIFGSYFMSSEIFPSKEKMIVSIYRSVRRDLNENILYYSDLTGAIGDDYYFRKINDLLEKFSVRIHERTGLKLKTMLISTDQSVPLSKTMTVFTGFDTESYDDSLNVAMTDMSRTLMNLCGIRPKNYFAGFDIDFSEVAQERDYFAGSYRDTLIMFNDSILYKKHMHSPEYAVTDKSTGKDITEENIGINEKLEDLIPRYFGGDYVKYIVLNNSTSENREFRIDLRSKRRFEEYTGLENYYSQKSAYNRYKKVITRQLEPGIKDTLRIYYAGLYQDFQYIFNDKYRLSYGALGTNAGEVKKFSENSYYGMVVERENVDPVSDYDIMIFNRRINY